MPRLLVIIGSTRPGRVGLPVTQWFADLARRHARFQVEVADLAEMELPLLDEPHHPRRRQYVHQHTKEWSERVDRADAVVLVTPEYNHGYPAALKNAIDYLHDEWADKPVGFVSYGGGSGGTRAVQQLMPVVAALRMLPVSTAVDIPFVFRRVDEAGLFRADDVIEQAATGMLDELATFEASRREPQSRQVA